MCGIAGIIRKPNYVAPIDKLDLEKMSSLISHRGPDDKGIHIDQKNRFGFAHRRLSIVDLSENGHQPMTSPNNNWIVITESL